MGSVPFMTKEICKLFICLINVPVVKVPCFDLELAVANMASISSVIRWHLASFSRGPLMWST